MKYTNQNNTFSIHTTDTNNQEITLWEIKYPLRIMQEQKGAVSHVFVHTLEGYIPLILANDWFIICSPLPLAHFLFNINKSTEQLLKSHIKEPIIFFDEKQQNIAVLSNSSSFFMDIGCVFSKSVSSCSIGRTSAFSESVSGVKKSAPTLSNKPLFM